MSSYKCSASIEFRKKIEKLQKCHICRRNTRQKNRSLKLNNQLPRDSSYSTFPQVVGYFDLPLYEPFPRIEREHDRHVLTYNSDGVRLFVEGEAALHPKKMFQAQRRFRLTLFVPVFAVSV